MESQSCRLLSWVPDDVLRIAQRGPEVALLRTAVAGEDLVDAGEGHAEEFLGPGAVEAEVEGDRVGDAGGPDGLDEAAVVDVPVVEELASVVLSGDGLAPCDVEQT